MGTSLSFRLVKVFDIGYITVIYSILGYCVLYSLYLVFGEYDKKRDEEKSTLHISLELIGLLWLSAIFFYIIRNVVGDNLPSPFHNIAGYNHYKLKEFTSASVFVYLFMQLFKPLKEKLKILYDRSF